LNMETMQQNHEEQMAQALEPACTSGGRNLESPPDATRLTMIGEPLSVSGSILSASDSAWQQATPAIQVAGSCNYPARSIALSAAQNWSSAQWSSMQQQQTWQPQQRVSHLSQQALFDLVSRHTALQDQSSGGSSQQPIIITGPPPTATANSGGSNVPVPAGALDASGSASSSRKQMNHRAVGSGEPAKRRRVHTASHAASHTVAWKESADGILDSKHVEELLAQGEKQSSDLDFMDMAALAKGTVESAGTKQSAGNPNNPDLDLVLPWGLFEGGADAAKDADFSNICLDNLLQDWLPGGTIVHPQAVRVVQAKQIQTAEDVQPAEPSLVVDSNTKVIQQHDGKVRQLWHKYGRKNVRSSPESKVQFQRAYFKCHEKLCSARLLVDSEVTGSSAPKLLKSVMTGHHNHKILYAASLGDAGTTDTGKPILSSCPVGSAAILNQKNADLMAALPARPLQARPKEFGLLDALYDTRMT